MAERKTVAVAFPAADAPRRRAPTWLVLGLRLLRREWRAGELRVLALALVIAVAAITAVGAFTDRLDRGMSRGASELLGADLVVLSTDPLAPELEREAQARGLATARTTTFRSVVIAGEQLQLAAVKAVSDGYPLAGRLRIADAPYGDDREVRAIPAPGTVWMEARLFGILDIGVGDRIELGRANPVVTRVISYEPDRGGEMFNIAPRLLMNAADVPATGLLQAGSRARYRLLLAGTEADVAAARAWLEARAARHGAGQRVQGVRDARPELRAALERAGQFLGLAALVSVLLAGAAIAVATRRYVARHLDTAAVMKCLGAAQATVVLTHITQVLVLGLAASLAGCALGYGAQYGLSALVGSLVLSGLPPPSPWPLATGLAVGLVVVAGFALPPLMGLRKVPPARVLRRELDSIGVNAATIYALSTLTFVALVAWRIDDTALVAWVLGGTVAALAALGLAALVLVRCLEPLRRRVGVSWRFGLANIARRRASSLLQIVAFGLGLTMLLLLTLVRTDLLGDWQRRLPAGTPNYFLINVQPDTVAGVGSFLADQGLEAAALFPMVRGRLAEIDGRRVRSEDYEDPRARRLATRDFNLSWAAELQGDNAVVAGRWWGPGEHGEALVSVEEGIAQTLGFALGDEIAFNIAGETVRATISNVRKVEWDTFNANFFVVFAPGVIDSAPATYITSFHLPPGDKGVLAQLVRRFPAVTVLDVDALITKVRSIMDQAVIGIEFVFLFTLAAGIVVLHAAVQSTLDERRRESALMRTLGAGRRRVLAGLLSEFVVLGALSGALAALAATAIGAVLARQVFQLTYRPDPAVWAAGLLGGAVIIALAGYLGTRTVLDQPPMTTLRDG